MSRSENPICPVCKNTGGKPRVIPSAVARELCQIQNTTHSQHALVYDCSSCGEFAITENDAEDARDSERPWKNRNRAHVSALLREHSIRFDSPCWFRFGQDPYGPLKFDELVPIDVDELLTRWPRTVPDRLDRMLCNLARLSKQGGDRIEMTPNDLSLAFAETQDEAQFHAKCLVDRGDVDNSFSDMRATVLILTAEGWERFEALTRGQSSPENAVFVAMWFGVQDKQNEADRTEQEMRALYDEGIQPAVGEAGYRVMRVDLVEHNEWIMDQVLGLIRLAPFVVADFTGHRNGVYFEAGFARGLGIPVIPTCEAAALDKAHFDTKQLNHVLWTTADELRGRLYHRIMQTVGPAPEFKGNGR